MVCEVIVFILLNIFYVFVKDLIVLVFISVELKLKMVSFCI